MEPRTVDNGVRQNELRERIEQMILDGALEGARAKVLVEADLGEPLLRRVSERQRHAAFAEDLVELRRRALHKIMVIT